MLWTYVIVGLVIVGLVVVGTALAPYPNGYDVSVAVQSYEISVVVGTVFGVSSVSGSTIGQSRILDFPALGGGFVPPVLVGSFKMTVCVGGSHCSSASSSTWFPSVPVVNGQTVTATNTFTVGYVPSGLQPITVVLTQNGQTAATGSGSVCVNGGC